MKIYGRHRHNCENPWDGASPRELELAAMSLYIIERITEMGVTLDRATASLEKLTNAATGVENLIDILIVEIRNTGTSDPLVLAKLDEIDAKSDEIVAKTLANTPAASQVPPAVA